MKRSILLAGIAAAAFSLSPVAYGQTSPTITNPTSPTTSNPKSDLSNAQCAQPQPGETHMNMAKCPKPTTSPTPTKTLPKKVDKRTATPANATQMSTPPPVLPTDPAQACAKPSTPSATAPTPSNPQCDSNSGAHEGGPFGH